MFEAYVKERDGHGARSGARRLTFAASLALHGVLLGAAVAHSFWHVDELSAPGVPVTFVHALAPPPPPRPPPAATQDSRVRPRAKQSAVDPVPIVHPSAEPVAQPVAEEKPEPAAEPEAEPGEAESPEGQAG